MRHHLQFVCLAAAVVLGVLIGGFVAPAIADFACEHFSACDVRK